MKVRAQTCRNFLIPCKPHVACMFLLLVDRSVLLLCPLLLAFKAVNRNVMRSVSRSRSPAINQTSINTTATCNRTSGLSKREGRGECENMGLGVGGSFSIRVFVRFTTLCWVGKHANITMKPTNSPTHGQPNPRKIRLKTVKSGLWATFSHSKEIFVGWNWFYIGNRLQKN